MSRLKDRLLNYHIQVKKFADDDQMILANDVLSMIEQFRLDSPVVREILANLNREVTEGIRQKEKKGDD